MTNDADGHGFRMDDNNVEERRERFDDDELIKRMCSLGQASFCKD